MPCDNCPIRSTCLEPCELLLPLLPKPDAGQERVLRRRTQAHLRKLIVNRDVADTMRRNAHLLTPRQRRIVEMYYRAGVSQTGIAGRLGIRVNSVEEALRAARLKIGGILKQEWLRDDVEEDDGGSGTLLRPISGDAEGPAQRDAGPVVLAVAGMRMPPPRLVYPSISGTDSLQSLPGGADDAPGEESAQRA